MSRAINALEGMPLVVVDLGSSSKHVLLAPLSIRRARSQAPYLISHLWALFVSSSGLSLSFLRKGIT